MLAAERRRINRRGHSIVAVSLLSGIKQSVGAQYKIPIGNLVSDRLIFSSTATWENVADDGGSRRLTLGVNRNEKWRKFQRQLYIRFEREDFTLGEDDQIVNYFIPGMTLSRLKADNVLFPRRGYSWSADMRGAAAMLVSDTNIIRAEATGRAVFPLAERARALFRLQAGGMAVEDFSELPTTERFYAGGDRSVRGYKYQSLGPTDESGENTGGRYLLTGSAEVDYLIWKKWGALEIRLVSVHTTDFQRQASGKLETAGDYPLESTLDWHLSSPNYADIQGRTTLSGNLKRLLVAQTLNETYPVSDDLVLTGLPATPSLEAKIRADGLRLKAIHNDLPDITLTADIQADGPVDALAGSGSLDINSDQLPTVQANLSAKLSTAKIELERLQLTSPAHHTERRISGSVELETDATRFDLRADWTRVRWPLNGDAQLESPSGQLHVKGSLDNYLVDSQMTLTAPGYSGADLALQGSGNQDALQLSELAIQTLNGHLQGTAMIAWRPRLETNIDIAGNSLDPGVIFSEWPGQLDVQLTSHAEFSSGGIIAQIPRLRVSGRLRDLPAQLETQGGYQKDTLTIKKLALVSGPSSLKLSGSIGASLDLDWNINSPDLNTLLPAAAGRLAGKGRVGSTFAAPAGRATLSGSDLRYGNDRLSDIEVDAVVDITAATESRIELKLAFDSRDLMAVWLLGHPRLAHTLARAPYAALGCRARRGASSRPVCSWPPWA